MASEFTFGALDVDPMTGMPVEVPQAHIDKAGRIAKAVGQGLKHWIETPGRAMREGITSEEAADWGAGTAFGMLGVGTPAGMLGPSAVGAAGGRLGRPKVPMDEASRLARMEEQGWQAPWYHGSMRMDRVIEKGQLNPKRATSGPMPFFTDSPEMASGYAMGKKGDTSLIDNGMIAEYFTVSPKDMGISGRTEFPVERSWYFLPPEVKRDILDRATRVGYADPDTASGPFTLHPPGRDATLSRDHYDWVMRHEARGNPLAALREMWHDGGNLVGNETALADIYRLAGYPYRISEKNAPWTEARGVLPVALRMRNPLLTESEETMRFVLPRLEEAFKRDRTRLQSYGADMWDKNTRFTPRDWVANAREDYAKGDNSFVWTSIPDKVTAQLRAQGFDSILDTGGKMGGQSHRVAIPFDPSQVRSVFARFDPANEGTGFLLGSGTRDPVATTFGTLAAGARNEVQPLRGYHTTRGDFDVFGPAPDYRGSTYFAREPQLASKGAGGGAQDWYQTDSQAPRRTFEVDIPNEGIAGLHWTPQEMDWYHKLPQRVVGDDAIERALAGQPNHRRIPWDDLYEMKHVGSDVYEYTKRPPKTFSWEEAARTGRDIYGEQLPGYQARDVETAKRLRAHGMKGFLVSDEGGASIAHIDPEAVRVLRRDVTLGSGTRDPAATSFGTLAVGMRDQPTTIDQLRRALDARHPGVNYFVSEHPTTGIIEVDKIVVPKEHRGQGRGTQFMRDVIEYADANGKTVALSPDTSFGGSKNRLESWYRSLGFKPNTGRSKDFSTRATMIRPPKVEK